MSSQSTRPTSTRPAQGHPGRTIGILLIAIIALFAIAFVQGATSVKLGLDLRGGTSVTLQPRIAPGESGKVTSEAIDQAVGIIRQRVNSLGVAESEVSSQGSGVNRQIVISVPGDTGRRVVELVGQTAELRFRQVLAEGTANAKSLTTDTATATLPAGITADIAAKFAALDCSVATNRQAGGGDDAASAIVACDRVGINKYVLAPAEVVGRDVSKAAAAIDQQGAAGWYVLLNFNNEGTSKFGALTTRVTGLATPQNQVAIVLDGLVVSAPRINEAITAGNAQITGSFTQTDATDLANVLKYGALPLAFDRGEVQQISPTLGNDQLHAGLLAGGLGLLLVVLYSLLYYRGLGLVSVGSLLVAAAIIFALFLVLGETIGFTLTLAGIAGAIVSIGITADSFIVYFERLRDEVREGRSLRSAVETGWARARRTIIVADLVSMIAAVLLYVFAVGGVRGFAFTLGLTTVVDLVVVFFFTKPLVTLLASQHFFASGHSLSGFSPRSLGVVQSNSNAENAKGGE
ncbi:MAG: protein translocase subunit SecD [Actinobacteria bacterium]|jgi:preprotein translocase subunit SecD|nr:protein translocase subunit SecD [Actinomycetota bacterium]